MQILNYIIAAFALLGALDRLFGNKLGIGAEFERGFELFGSLALAMIGMLVLVPVLADLLQPMLDFLRDVLHLEPSVIPASLIANDMGGAAFSVQVAADPALGMFNGLIVSCMMGATISFTIPFSLTTVPKEKHRELLLGMLCGVVTIPLGCLLGGMLAKIPMGALLADLLPLILLSALLAIGLALCPDFCAKLFRGLGFVIKALITVGLGCSVLEYLTGIAVIPGLGKLEDAAGIALSCSIYLAGVLPLLALVTRLLSRPMKALGERLRINEHSVLAFIATLASGITTFALMEKMDRKGVLLNAAFAISAAFVFADHLAFTMAFNGAYVGPVVAAKLAGGASALVLAGLLSRRFCREEPVRETAN
ncbi:MAG: ethanolamine utilization protein EutH [Oscillospiraceae bacterium]|nr:ethanolamine utilization protein EutH [Oscillospiraceae bacterium]